MRSPLDDVPIPPSKDLENASQRLVFWAGFFLLIFALGYLIVFPNHEKESFSEVSWVDRPHFVAQTDGPLETGFIVFSVRLRSFEKENVSYRVNVQYEGRTIATKNISLNVSESKSIDFSIPVQGKLDSQNQIHVVVAKPNQDSNASTAVSLELVGYFSN